MLFALLSRHHGIAIWQSIQLIKQTPLIGMTGCHLCETSSNDVPASSSSSSTVYHYYFAGSRSNNTGGRLFFQ